MRDASLRPEAAYAAFRRWWNSSPSHRREALGRVGTRRERFAGWGCPLPAAEEAALEAEFGGTSRPRAWLLGLLGPCYCWMTGWRWMDARYPEMGEAEAGRYLLWLTGRGGGRRVARCGLRDGLGRTAPRRCGAWRMSRGANNRQSTNYIVQGGDEYGC